MTSSGPVKVMIPSLGVSMTDGTLEEWLVADGSEVAVGELLYLISTDKVEFEIESPAAGTIRQIGVEGETYDVGTVIAEIFLRRTVMRPVSAGDHHRAPATLLWPSNTRKYR